MDQKLSSRRDLAPDRRLLQDPIGITHGYGRPRPRPALSPRGRARAQLHPGGGDARHQPAGAVKAVSGRSTAPAPSVAIRSRPRQRPPVPRRRRTGRHAEDRSRAGSGPTYRCPRPPHGRSAVCTHAVPASSPPRSSDDGLELPLDVELELGQVVVERPDRGSATGSTDAGGGCGCRAARAALTGG